MICVGQSAGEHVPEGHQDDLLHELSLRVQHVLNLLATVIFYNTRDIYSTTDISTAQLTHLQHN